MFQDSFIVILNSCNVATSTIIIIIIIFFKSDSPEDALILNIYVAKTDPNNCMSKYFKEFRDFIIYSP